MSLKFYENMVAASVVIRGNRMVFTGCNIAEIFEKIGVELCK
ncbi:MAG: hypothetical protein ACRDDK_02260 [Cetobacterium sp.]